MHSKIVTDIRYDFAVESAYDFLIEQNINSLPFDPFKICRLNGWKIEKASIVARDLGCSVHHLLTNKLKTKDGAAIYCPYIDQYSIVYNDLIKSPGRILWTITHEIGHIVLNHLNDDTTMLSRGGLDDTTYSNYEKEADCFAGIVLAPPIVVKKLNINSSNKLRDICKLSFKASISRIQYIHKIYNFKTFKDYYPIIEDNFYKFIYKKNCLKCGFGFISKTGSYCSICGFDKITRGDGKVIYKGYELDERGRVLECPICDNEQMATDGAYCKVCGTYLINKCTNNDGVYKTNENGYTETVKEPCGMIAEGNARYCELCGEPTTFYRDELLKSWQVIKSEEQTATSSEYNYLDDVDIPF